MNNLIGCVWSKGDDYIHQMDEIRRYRNTRGAILSVSKYSAIINDQYEMKKSYTDKHHTRYRKESFFTIPLEPHAQNRNNALKPNER